MIRACIFSDVRLYRDGLAEILGGQRQIAVVASLAYGDGDLEAAERLEPEVVLLDVAGSEGESALRRFVGRLPQAHFVALTVSDSEAQIVACAEAGVDGFLTCTSSLAELVAAVESAARGESVCPPKVAAVLLRRVQTLSRGRPRAGAATRLTPREHEILELLSVGLSNKQIARHLSIELSTAKNHVHNILAKLGVHQRADAAVALGDPLLAASRRRNGERI
jgi:two-component system nitrate/nitrite response regulator NarL